MSNSNETIRPLCCISHQTSAQSGVAWPPKFFLQTLNFLEAELRPSDFELVRGPAGSAVATKDSPVSSILDDRRPLHPPAYEPRSIRPIHPHILTTGTDSSPSPPLINGGEGRGEEALDLPATLEAHPLTVP